MDCYLKPCPMCIEGLEPPHKALLLTFVASLVGPLFGREALLWFVDIASFGTALAYLYVAFSTYRQTGNLALNNNKREHHVKITAILSSIASLALIALLSHQLWLNYRLTPFIVIVAYTFLGLLLYKLRRQ